MTLKNAYLGYFAIHGELLVTQDTNLNSNVIIGGNNTIGFDSYVYGNVYINKNISKSKLDRNICWAAQYLKRRYRLLRFGIWLLFLLKGYRFKKSLLLIPMQGIAGRS